jgi:hypothetical protein
MKKWLALMMTVGLLLSGCAKETPTEETTAAATEITVPATQSTERIQSVLYLPDYTTEQIQEYFAEVVLNMEYTDGTGDAKVVHKWLGPIWYGIYGMPTGEDLAVLQGLFDQLNAIEGFPGIYAAEYVGQENMSLSFLEPNDFREGFSHVVYGEDAYGATQFWYYTDTNELYTARIGYRTDIDQSVRNSILVEEVINSLGITDTVLRPDSVVYQYSNENTALTDVDLVILKLLYDPAIRCGMDAEGCSDVIWGRYY